MQPAPAAPPRPRRSGLGVVIALGVTAITGLVTAALLAAVAFAQSDPTPESCCPSSAASPAPATTPAARQRAAPLPICLIGTWRVVSEANRSPFYSSQPPLAFTSAGRIYEFRPDGTMSERLSRTTFTSTDGRLKKVYTGTRQYTWTAAGSTLSYLASIATDVSIEFYDGGRRVDTIKERVETTSNEIATYTCGPEQATRSNPDVGYQATWARIEGYGRYP